MSTSNSPISVSDPIAKEIECKDGTLRSFGGIRLSPTIARELEWNDISRDILSVDPPFIDGEDPFEFCEHIVYVSRSVSDYNFPQNIWISVKLTESDYSVPHPETDIISPLILYNPLEECAVAKRLTLYDHDPHYLVCRDSQFTEGCRMSDVTFFDVPDTHIRTILVENGYKAELVSQTI